MHFVAETFKPFDFPIIRIDLKPSAVTINMYKGTLYYKWATKRRDCMYFVSKNCSELIWEKIVLGIEINFWDNLDQFIQVKGKNDFWEIIDFLDLTHLKNWLGCGKLQKS